ncbi:uncharacterized protein LOC131307353 [Rhododendron vialii]|uniref:uncharacterized protein LOC131307353 n=1 Tax=Rhododendron vialii TaxID=182163 RepID=UPI00265EB44F|nr:uncharacterized protein LOC131307353 [Rhododendron vialii]
MQVQWKVVDKGALDLNYHSSTSNRKISDPGNMERVEVLLVDDRCSTTDLSCKAPILMELWWYDQRSLWWLKLSRSMLPFWKGKTLITGVKVIVIDKKNLLCCSYVNFRLLIYSKVLNFWVSFLRVLIISWVLFVIWSWSFHC